MPATKTCPHFRNLRNAFDARYGAALRNGFLPTAVVSDLIRGLAFHAVTMQDEATNLATVLPKIEAAVIALCEELKAV